MQRHALGRIVLVNTSALIILVTAWLGFVVPASALSIISPPIVMAAKGLFSFSGQRPANLGVREGQLISCPQSPNCVSSQSQDPAHAIAPLSYASDPEAAFSQLKTIIQNLPRTEIIQATDDYLYAEFASALMGFVDDVEFYLDRSANVIQVRSASRLGESDLGVNRKRIESIRSRLSELA